VVRSRLAAEPVTHLLQEIRDAIEKHDRPVLIVGPAALAWSYVEAAWRYALERGRVVLPVAGPRGGPEAAGWTGAGGRGRVGVARSGRRPVGRPGPRR
jgi:hypothetical protein